MATLRTRERSPSKTSGTRWWLTSPGTRPRYVFEHTACLRRTEHRGYRERLGVVVPADFRAGVMKGHRNRDQRIGSGEQGRKTEYCGGKLGEACVGIKNRQTPSRAQIRHRRDKRNGAGAACGANGEARHPAGHRACRLGDIGNRGKRPPGTPLLSLPPRQPPRGGETPEAHTAHHRGSGLDSFRAMLVHDSSELSDRIGLEIDDLLETPIAGGGHDGRVKRVLPAVNHNPLDLSKVPGSSVFIANGG